MLMIISFEHHWKRLLCVHCGPQDGAAEEGCPVYLDFYFASFRIWQSILAAWLEVLSSDRNEDFEVVACLYIHVRLFYWSANERPRFSRDRHKCPGKSRRRQLHDKIPSKLCKQHFGRKIRTNSISSSSHYGTKPGHFETSIIHFPTSEGVSEVSKRANE